MKMSVGTRLHVIWDGRVGVIGLAMGLLPHILHHIGFLAGSVLILGSGGTAIFGFLGLLFTIPMLSRLYKRHGTWRAPVIALVIFASMFLLSTLVLGPMMSGQGDETSTSVQKTDHTSHH